MPDQDQAIGQTTSPKPPKGRSPNYPGIPLPKAIERARKIYDEVQQFELPLAAVTSRWGFKAPTTGPASVTYAALKKFGLLEDHGKGNDRAARITDLAIEILHPNNPNHQAAVQKAALMPDIHRKWWAEYKLDIPPYEALEWTLVTRGPWTANGLKDFIREYRETMTFAKLDSTASVTREELNPEGNDGDDDETEFEGDEDRGQQDNPPLAWNRLRQPRKPGVKTYAIPVDADHDAMIELPTPMTPGRWKNFMTFLNAMEGIIVSRANLLAPTAPTKKTSLEEGSAKRNALPQVRAPSA